MGVASRTFYPVDCKSHMAFVYIERVVGQDCIDFTGPIAFRAKFRAQIFRGLTSTITSVLIMAAQVVLLGIGRVRSWSGLTVFKMRYVVRASTADNSRQ